MTPGMTGCYYAASSNMQFEEFLTRHGLLGSTAPNILVSSALYSREHAEE